VEKFVIASALAFVFYQFLAHTHWPRSRGSYSIGSVSITFDQATESWARRIVRSLLIFGALASILFAHSVVFPGSTAWEGRANIILGFMFGPMLAIWINSVLHHSSGDALTKGQIIGGVGLILFFILGSVGREAGTLLEQLARNISSVKVPGAEIQLLARPAGTTTPSPTLDLPSERYNTAVLSSSGLLRLAHLDEWAIKADQKYIETVDRASAKDLDAVRNFTRRMVEPPFRCLSSWLQTTADETTVNSHLAAFSAVFRQVDDVEGSKRKAEVGKAFIGRSLAIAVDVLEFRAPDSVITGCQDLFKELCPKIVSEPSKPSDLIVMLECIRPREEMLRLGRSKDDPRLGELVGSYEEYLKSFSAGHGAKVRPYFAVGYASIMAQLGHYEAAAAILFKWLDPKEQGTQKDPSKKEPEEQLPQKVRYWYDLRARATLATYLEEWVRRDGQKIPTVVLDEHLKNLDDLRKKLLRHLAGERYFHDVLQRTMTDAPLKLTPPVRNGCHYTATDSARTALQKRLFRAYVALDLAYQKNALQHPEYGTKFAKTTPDDLKWLAQLDLSCAALEPEKPEPEKVEPEKVEPENESQRDSMAQQRDADLLYVQVMETYSRSALNRPAAGGAPESEDRRKMRLAEATRAAQVGLRVLQDAMETEAETRRRPFLERLTLREAAVIRDALTQNLRALEQAQKAPPP
jgi:hypothetical protein